MDLLNTSLERIPNNNGIRRVGIVTSGGDSPGMNAAIRAVTRSALAKGLDVYGIEEGYLGLYEKRFHEFSAGSVGDIIHRGGTILRTARLPQFKDDKAIRQKCYDNLKAMKIDALVVLGGDGSFQGANLLSNEMQQSGSEMRVACLPCTIDNDLAYSDFAIGFDTAINTCVNLINNLRDTMASHDRISVVEVMGRNCGDIAIYAGIAGGAEAIIIPEIDRTDEEWIEYVIGKLKQTRLRKKEYGIIIMAEGMHLQKGRSGMFTAQYLSQRINEYTCDDTGFVPFESRSVEFAHIQRGGSPTVSDRLLASTLGFHAIKVLLAGENRRCIGTRDGKVYDTDITQAIKIKRAPNQSLIDIADILAR